MRSTILVFILLALADNQITHIVVVSYVFEGLRAWIRGDHLAKNKRQWYHRYFGELIGCHLCCGTWVGLLLQLATGFTLVPVQAGGIGLTWFLNGMLIAFGGRVVVELMGLLVTANKLLEVKIKPDEIALYQAKKKGTENGKLTSSGYGRNGTGGNDRP